MQLPERAFPVRMRRVAVVVARERRRAVLVTLAKSGVVDLSGRLGGGEGAALEALRRLERTAAKAERPVPAIASWAPDIDVLERHGARELLAGEVEIERRKASAVEHGEFALLVGWAPADALARVREQLEPVGAALLELPVPRGAQPPTLLAPAPAADPFRPLVTTYGAIPYQDLDPTPLAAIAYCLMFGMMFADVGDGALIVLAALWLRRGRHPRLRALRRIWPMIAAAGAASILFGVLYGELFGPSRLLPVLWVEPLGDPIRLLVVAVVLGACLLAAGYLVAVVNRLREGGRALALTAASGVPGLTLLGAGGLIALGMAAHAVVPEVLGFVLVAPAVAALALGLRSEAGRGATAVAVVAIGLLDALLRLLSNVFSFARLGAFGLMHAAIGQVVLHGAGGLTGSAAGDLAAGVVFVLGGAVSFALEGLVVAVQALRLEYYELFSRILVREGRPFRPWSLPLVSGEEAR